jgi:fructose-1,6-bisphosphatase-3
MQSAEESLIYLRALAELYPSIDAALGRIAVLSATLTLPKGTIHVISDVHGEYKKLRHVINNASGSLKLLLQELCKDRLSEAEQLRLLSFIYYPRESYQFYMAGVTDDNERLEMLEQIIGVELEVVRSEGKSYPLHAIAKLLPEQYLQFFRELILSPQFQRQPQHMRALLQPFLKHRKELELLRFSARLVRNLSISELIVAGDLGDRGPRIDKSIALLMHQPRVALTWGNHDMHWMGACLGHPPCIASTLRMSLRYGRISQLEEGYGIPLEPLEKLATTVYGDDPATAFASKETGGRDPLLLARMQKAIAVLQFKLEGGCIRRNPHFQLEHRNLLTTLRPGAGTVVVDGATYPLLDTHFPTFDPNNPEQLTPEEQGCLDAFVHAYTESPSLWTQMSFMARYGKMFLVRDDALIFHGCVPCDEQGNFLSFEVDGRGLTGRALFEAIEVVVQRAFERPTQTDLDLFWYLWCGPLSPLFGKDKIAVFESYLIESPLARKEEKNPYFRLIHETPFCEKVLSEFGVDTRRGLIVNGHMPVKVEQGESPLKRSGKAVTIDGAFSEVYGDRGYTLVLRPERTYIALHHHFDSVEDSIRQGTDMVPVVQEISRFEKPRLIADTEEGADIRAEIQLLEKLIQAYRERKL